ncbi:DUF58 domain-containing protein [uncultured Flavonifractor sp.]|uniref:DUF58 domain-containing protein n=1 Tax=uncultured Flavonifractor sp. TaxID=1193534 RepID=UPI002616F6E1|nr:DUF58 domain-containing protein [uncultured Flavonifractor sp.]
MGAKPIFSRSSTLVVLPTLAGTLVLCLLAAFFGYGKLAAVLMFLFLLALAARLWAVLALRGLDVSAAPSAWGVFPGDTLTIPLRVHNGKFLPLVWAELFFPLSPQLCLVPEESREPDEREQSTLAEDGYSTQLVGERRLSFLLWYETVPLTIRWTARRRGVYSTAGWRVRTGDGFGLVQVEAPILQGGGWQLAVYPRLIKVRPELFLRNRWNSDTGARGVMEDPTVIRSTRDYQTTDSLKRINWRLAARCLPLTVNIYEDILPRGVHFLLDGESFSGPQPHPEELEDALSVLASLVVRLSALQVPCGLSLCRGSGGEAVNLFAAATEEMLFALAAYQVCPPKWDENGALLSQAPIFQEPALFEAARSVGRFYYILYDAARLDAKALPHRLGSSCTTLLTCLWDGKPAGEFETVPLEQLKEVGSNG